MRKILLIGLLLLIGNWTVAQDCDCGELYATDDVHFEGTGATTLQNGTTAQRPTAANGMVRYNTTTNKFEVYESGAWLNLLSIDVSVYDPGDDRLFGWDNSETSLGYFSLGTGLSFSTTNLTLDADLVALSGLGSTGIAVRSAADTWVQRTLTGTANEITITNGDGVSGNPTMSLPTALTFTGKTITGGTYSVSSIEFPDGSTQTSAPSLSGGHISTSLYNQNFDVSTQELLAKGLFFKPDGLKMYIIGNGGDDVNEYDLSTPWDVSTAVFNQLFDVSGQGIGPVSIFFRSDGLKFYVVDDANDEVDEYDLGTAWNVSTAVYNQNFPISAQSTSPTGIHFKPDGTKMYIVANNDDEVNEYDLSTAWDVSTASFNQLISVNTEEAFPTGLFFRADGFIMYVIGQTGQEINQYSLSTPWDISTAIPSQLFDVSSQGTSPQDLFVKPDGNKVYVVDDNSDVVNEYDIGIYTEGNIIANELTGDVNGVTLTTGGAATAFLNATGTYTVPAGAGDVAKVGTPVDNQLGVWTGDGTLEGDVDLTWTGEGLTVNKPIVFADSSTQISAATPSDFGWHIETGIFNQLFDVSTQEIGPSDVDFKPDGTKMYIVGTGGDEVNEYDLSTPWDVSTSVFNQLFDVSSQGGNPTGLFFKPDGTKMYVVNVIDDEVNEYDLSTPWDVSTSVFNQLFDVSTEDDSPRDIGFKPDGTKMYIIGLTGQDVNEYSLSTPWDISTASFIQLFSVATEDTQPEGIDFKPDGTKMYVVGGTGVDINEYSLYIPWNISTASFVNSFDVSGQESSPNGSAFKPDGTKMYIVGNVGDEVNEYDLGIATDGKLIISNGEVISGTWTPTFTNDTNVTGATLNNSGANYSRVGNIVTFTIKIDLTVTTGATNSIVSFSIPIASNFTNSGDGIGNCSVYTNSSSAQEIGILESVAADDDISVFFYPATSGVKTLYVTGQYEIK